MKRYKRKSVQGTDALIDWLNNSGVQPKQIVAVNFDGDWRNVLWWEELKEEKKTEAKENDNAES